MKPIRWLHYSRAADFGVVVLERAQPEAYSFLSVFSAQGTSTSAAPHCSDQSQVWHSRAILAHHMQVSLRRGPSRTYRPAPPPRPPSFFTIELQLQYGRHILRGFTSVIIHLLLVSTELWLARCRMSLVVAAGKIEGDIRINGHPKQQSSFARVSGYVEQFDTHTAAATVREALLFSGTLRNGKDVDMKTTQDFVQQVRFAAPPFLFPPRACNCITAAVGDCIRLAV